MKDRKYIKSKSKMRHFLMALMLFFSGTAVTQAQVMDNSHRVDTLSFAERLTLRTNAVDWVLMVPNIGIEFDIFPQNYNRWSVGVNLRYRPSTTSSQVFPAIFDLFEVSLEGRQYWRERQATASGYLRPHRMWYDKILSCRNMLPSHPKWIFYRGGYVSYAKYSYFLDGIFNGRQGVAYQAGVTWGFTTPLYNFMNGNSISLECGISLGAVYKKESKYKYDKRNSVYYFTQDESERDKGEFCPYPVPHDLHVALAYHFGDYPIQKKYRWRYDADLQYRDMIDSLYLDMESKALTRYINDSIYDVVYSEFRHVYDSVLAIIQQEEKEEAIARTAQKKLELKAALDSIEGTKMTRAEKKAAKAAQKAQEEAELAAEMARHKAATAALAPAGEGAEAEGAEGANGEGAPTEESAVQTQSIDANTNNDADAGAGSSTETPATEAAATEATTTTTSSAAEEQTTTASEETVAADQDSSDDNQSDDDNSSNDDDNQADDDDNANTNDEEEDSNDDED